MIFLFLCLEPYAPVIPTSMAGVVRAAGRRGAGAPRPRRADELPCALQAVTARLPSKVNAAGPDVPGAVRSRAAARAPPATRSSRRARSLPLAPYGRYDECSP